MKLKMIAASVALALGHTALAADETLDEVLVTAPQVPVAAINASKTDAATMRRSHLDSDDSGHALGAQPGINLNQAGGFSALPSIRGLADDRLRIKVDGVDVVASCPNHMNSPLSYINPSQLESIPVYAGITPVSVGGDSIGGSIIAQSAAPRFAASADATLLEGEFGLGYRSNSQSWRTHASATVASDQVSLHYSGAFARADNYDAGGKFKSSGVTGRAGHVLPLDEVGSTAYRNSNQSLGLAWRNAQHLIDGKVSAQEVPQELFPNQRMDMLRNSERRLNLHYAGTMSWGLLDARTYFEKVEHRMNFGDDKRFWYGAASGGLNGPGNSGNGVNCAPSGTAACAAGMPMDTNSNTKGATLHATLNTDDETLWRLGAELQRYQANDYWSPSGANMFPNVFYNLNGADRDRNALFAEWEYDDAARWKTQLGMRWELVDMNTGAASGYNPLAGAPSFQQRDAALFNAQGHHKTDNNIDLTAVARYAPDALHEIEFGLARKVRSPNLYERYTWSSWQMAALMNNFVGDGNGYFGDINLKPEKAHTVSAALDGHAENEDWQWKLSSYLTRVTDYIDAVQWDSVANVQRAVPLKNQFTVLRYRNQTARLVGFDLSGKVNLGNTDFGGWSLDGALNYIRGKNLDSGTNLYQIMPLNARLDLGQRVAAWENHAELLLVKDKNKVSETRNEVRTPGYALFNLYSTYRWSQLQIDLGIENLLDKMYFLPTGGAYVGQGTTMTLNGVSSPVWGVAIPGRGRSFNVGATVKF